MDPTSFFKKYCANLTSPVPNSCVMTCYYKFSIRKYLKIYSETRINFLFYLLSQWNYESRIFFPLC